MRRSSGWRTAWVVGVLLLGGMAGGCSGPEFYARERLVHPAMTFDFDAGLASIRNKIDAAREGGLGGFGAARAGGCACQ